MTLIVSGYFIMTESVFVHVIAKGMDFFLRLKKFMFVHIWVKFSLSLILMYSLNNVAMKMGMQICHGNTYCILFGCVDRNGIAGTHDSCVFILLMNLQTVLCDDWNNAIPWHCLQGFPSPILSILSSLFFLGTVDILTSDNWVFFYLYSHGSWWDRELYLFFAFVCFQIPVGWLHVSFENNLVNSLLTFKLSFSLCHSVSLYFI